MGDSTMSNELADLADQSLSADAIQQVIGFLRKNGLMEAEEVFAREAAARLGSEAVVAASVAAGPSTVSNDALFVDFAALLEHVDSLFDFNQAEMSLLIFPVFAHSFLKMLVEGNPNQARQFFERFSDRVPAPYDEYVEDLGALRIPLHVQTSPTAAALLKQPFIIRLNKPSLRSLEPFLSRHSALHSIVKDHVTIEPTEFVSRARATVELQMGGLLGQWSKSEKKQRVFWAVARDEVGLAIEKRRSRLRELASKDANPAAAPPLSTRRRDGKEAPPNDRIPIVLANHLMRAQKALALKDATRMTFISNTLPPSVCLYTALNALGGALTSSSFSEDSTLLAMGFANSTIVVHALDESRPLRAMNAPEVLERSIDVESFDAYQQLFDPSTAAHSINLVGHSQGAVHSVNLSADNRLLLSSASDSTVRLWSLDVRKNLVLHRHPSPVWDTAFCPRGYYFATAGSDGTAQLWSTDRVYPLRVMTDPLASVSCIDFHLNSNYVAGGSDDRTVRLWDLLSGQCVRTFTAHRGPVRGVKISTDGRYIVSVGSDASIYVWDIAQHRLLGAQQRASTTVSRASIAFSQDGGVFAISFGTPQVQFYSLDSLVAMSSGGANTAAPSANETIDPHINADGFRLYSYATKQTPLVGVHFTRRNLLLACGAFAQH